MSARLVPAVLLSLAASACRSAGNEPPAPPVVTSQMIVRACPLGVPDTSVSLEELPDRFVVVFATTPENVYELRARIAHQGAQNGPEKHEGMGHDGTHGAFHNHGLRLWTMPPLRTIIQETSDGARLHVMPLDSNDFGALRQKLRERVRLLAEKDCPRGE